MGAQRRNTTGNIVAKATGRAPSTVTPCLRNPPVILLEWLCELVASLLRKKRPRAPALTIKTVRLASLTDCAAAVDFRIAIQ